jgi:hypothetical protein
MSSYTTSHEFQGLSPNSQCYTTLGAYNSGTPTQTMAPIPAAQVLANTTLLIPAWGSMGYSSLTHGASGNCTNYFTRTNAYPGIDNQGNCTALKYLKRDACGY